MGPTTAKGCDFKSAPGSGNSSFDRFDCTIFQMQFFNYSIIIIKTLIKSIESDMKLFLKFLR